MNAIQAEEPNGINNRIHDKRPQHSTGFQLAVPAIQAQRVVSMSAQGNALGWASHADQSPNGAALFNWDRTLGANRNRAFRAAPLGLGQFAARLPRALPWADIGLARWAGTHSRCTGQHHLRFRTNNRIHDTRPQLSTDFQSAIPAIQAQRAVSMSAQGNALGLATHTDQSPNGAALTTMKGS